MPTLALTEARARNLPEGEYQDDSTPALRLIVTAKGARNWQYYKWSPSRRMPIRKRLGTLKEMPLDDARKAAKAMAEGLEKTPEPEAPTTTEPTLDELTNRYTLKSKIAGNRTQWVRSAMDRSFPDWLSKRLRDLTKPMISGRHLEISAGRGSVTATMAIKALRALYAYALDEELYAGVNVAKLVKVKSIGARRRVLNEGEYGRFLSALDTPELDWWVRPYFRLLMLTGVRKSNLCSVEWSEVDLDAGVWTIPAEKAKAKDEMLVHLTPEAVTILRAIRAEERSAKFIFPSYGRKGHLHTPFNAWRKVLGLAGLPVELRVHDLRRTFGSRLLNQGVAMAYVSKALGHKNVATTAKHYAHADEGRVRESVLGASL
jgi:integrase